MKEYTLENQYIYLRFLDLGGIITKLVKKQTDTNYVLNYADYENYQANPYYFGATIGRVAGRTFPPYYHNYHEQKVDLDINENRLHLHGGNHGLHNRIWDVRKSAQNEYVLLLVDKSPMYAEMGFKITYRLLGNLFDIEYSGISKEPTVCNLTNHSYFNLNKDKSLNILNHYLKTSESEIQLVDEHFVPTGIYSDMKEDYTNFNFNEGKRIFEGINGRNDLSSYCLGGIDLAYIFKEEKGPSIELKSNDRLNTLRIHSNQESCVIYTLNKISKKVKVNNCVPISQFSGITFEMQRRPNYIHSEKDYLDSNYYSETFFEII